MLVQAVSVVLFEPSGLFRQGLTSLLRRGGFEVVGGGTSVMEAAAVASAFPNAELVLFAPVGPNAREAVAELRRLYPRARIVALAEEGDPRTIALALHAGADGILVKDIPAETLVQSLHLIMAGQKVLPAGLAATLTNGRVWGEGPPIPSTGTIQSPREIEILRCLVNGDSNKEIANRLGITDATVKVHVKKVLRKIGVRTRTQAAIWALNHLPPGR